MANDPNFKNYHALKWLTCIYNKANNTDCFNRMLTCDYFYAALYELGYIINCWCKACYIYIHS